MPALSILLKPASSLCNLRCSYCFYHSLSSSREIQSFGIMTSQVAETIIKRVFEYADSKVFFGFQGGEPSLAGIEFYENFVSLVDKYNYKKYSVTYSFQTNATHIDKDWAKFFKKSAFIIGVSLDGIDETHNITRFDSSGNGTFKRVMESISILKEYQVPFNILTVVNKYVANKIHQIYRFFKENGFNYLQFIPCLNPLNDENSVFEYVLTNEDYLRFLKKLFRLWTDDLREGRFVSIRQFDNYLRIINDLPPEQCGMHGFCTAYYLIESGGQVYPCDFYAIDDWYLGNIKDLNFKKLHKTDVFRTFYNQSLHIDPKCKDCKWFNICKGGCRRHREPISDGLISLNLFCDAYYEFFEFAYDTLIRINPKLVGIDSRE